MRSVGNTALLHIIYSNWRGRTYSCQSQHPGSKLMRVHSTPNERSDARTHDPGQKKGEKRKSRVVIGTTLIKYVRSRQEEGRSFDPPCLKRPLRIRARCFRSNAQWGGKGWKPEEGMDGREGWRERGGDNEMKIAARIVTAWLSGHRWCVPESICLVSRSSPIRTITRRNFHNGHHTDGDFMARRFSLAISPYRPCRAVIRNLSGNVRRTSALVSAMSRRLFNQVTFCIRTYPRSALSVY